jgi:geranylgeranyl pyrophosphate synthase/predicted secreted hydrolase
MEYSESYKGPMNRNKPMRNTNLATSRYPIDWPEDGPIDLAVHDLPHRSSATEWWYVNAHLESPTGNRYGIFASFFRVLVDIDKQTDAPVYAYSLTWAISDLRAGRYLQASFVDRDAPRLGREKLDRGEGSSDKRLRRAMREVIDKGNVPYPDRMFISEPVVGTEQLDLDFDGARFVKDSTGVYRLCLLDEGQDISCVLTFRLHKDAVRHGENGVVKGVDGTDMFYYFVPRCDVMGSLRIADQRSPLFGYGWYDHEFGGCRQERDRPKDQVDRELAWNWVAVQLPNHTEITAYEILNPLSGEQLGQRCLVIEPDSTCREYLDFELLPLNTWRSTRTFNTYPTRWQLRVPDAGIDLSLTAEFDDQEFITLISKPAFWEGRCQASGIFNGREISASAYVERSGFPTVDTLGDFFGEVGKETRRSVQSLLPFEPSYERVRDLIAAKDRDAWMEGVDISAFSRSFIKPVREVVDRGGKAWRSYAALACCDVVGGDSRQYVQWLAMPELLHVGSLIIDDVEDQSRIRRGGPCCHVIHGEPIAINAGSACYFLGQKLLASDSLSDRDKLRIYDLYFAALRAGHSGQALDLYGVDDVMNAAVESGESVELEARIRAIHRLKTAAPAASLARMGAVAGGGTDEQIEVLGCFFESVGLAFQIMDDVLNLRGFKGDLKSRGEDISRGVVTYPIAKAVSRLDLENRRNLWKKLKSKPDERRVIDGVIADLEVCGAIEDCVQEAHQMVENAWTKLDPLVEDSLPKLMLRAFGWFVLERQY